MNKLMEDEILEYRKQITERSRNTEEPKEEKKPANLKEDIILAILMEHL
jgi:hypothetical protein